MHHHFTVVLAGAAAHFLTGWVLNCDMFLGKIWKHEKHEKEGKNCSKKDMRISIAAQIIVSIALAIATSVAIAIFEKSQIPSMAQSALEKLASLFFNKSTTTKDFMDSIRIVMFIWAGFIIPTSIEDVIWCSSNWKHWALEMLSELLGLIAIALTVTYLS